MRRVRIALATLTLLALLIGTLSPVRADDEPPVAAEEEEPELEGAAKRKHDKEVKKIVRYLHKEKFWTKVQSRIDQLGKGGTRVDRDALMRYIATNKNSERINYALKALATIKGKKTLEFICGKKALRSRDSLVQIYAAEALEILKDKRAVDPLLEVMTSKRTKTKAVCACALAMARLAPENEEVIKALMELTLHRKDTIAAYAISALGYVKTDEALERIVDALHNDSNTRVREYAARALEAGKRTEALNELRKAYVKEDTRVVRDAIVSAIKALEGG